jgi:signal peptidase II
MIPAVIVFIILSLDQATKIYLSRILRLNESIPVIKNFLDITMVHNRGAAFGIFRNQVYLFIISAILAILLVVFNLKNNKHNKYYLISLSLILAGAIGNLIDRVRLGYVIDFLNFHFWPVFNVADSAITIGAVMLAWAIFKGKD